MKHTKNEKQPQIRNQLNKQNETQDTPTLTKQPQNTA